MNIKKALSFVAFGFLFILVNINLNFGDKAVNIMPAFVGWILMLLAYDKLGSYISDKPYMKWCSLVMIILTAVTYILNFMLPEVPVILTSIADLVTAVYEFILLGCLVRLADDYHSANADTLHKLRILNAVFYGVVSVLAIAVQFVDSREIIVTIGTVVLIFGLAVLVTAIITCVTLFKLRKEISEKITE